MKDQWIEWLQDNQRRFFYGVTLVIAIFFVAFQIFGKFHKSAHRKILASTRPFEKWLVHGEAVDRLEEAVKLNPELETKFGAVIADKFIIHNDGERACPFAERVFQRIVKQAPEHAVFARGSLLISKGQFQDALVEAISLKKGLSHDTLLFGFNLVRIASLCCALKTPAAEREALDQLELFMESHEQAATVLGECFHEGEMTLLDYIHSRKSQVD
jgi:hypothetical protein